MAKTYEQSALKQGDTAPLVQAALPCCTFHATGGASNLSCGGDASPSTVIEPTKAGKFEGMSNVDGEQFAHYSGVVL
jgi:hypothetical protein